MVTSEATGHGRITVFSVFGPAFAYATRTVEGRQIAFIGPVTPGVGWRKLWQMATQCGSPRGTEQERARWIITQANRALICGDVVVNLSDSKWEMSGGGRVTDVENWCGSNVLVTGDMHVPDLTAEQTARQFTYWPEYAV